MGAGGGVMLLAVMALVMPAAAIIPVHGMVQLGSNANRVLLTWRDVNWRVIAWFAPGVILGAYAASLLLVRLPLELVQLSIAAFILVLCWGPAIPKVATGPVGTLLASTVTSFVSLFVGATGPLVAAFIKQQQSHRRLQTVATFAAAMTLQHLPKAFAFTAAGFIFHDWLGPDSGHDCGRCRRYMARPASAETHERPAFWSNLQPGAYPARHSTCLGSCSTAGWHEPLHAGIYVTEWRCAADKPGVKCATMHSQSARNPQ